MEISVIARTIDDKDLSDLLDYVNGRGEQPIVECGLPFAHEPVVDGRTFAKRKKAQAKRAMENGLGLIEVEGVYENVKSGEERWDFVDDFAADFEVRDLMFEADDQDVISYYVNAYGPKVNVFVDNSQVMQIEAARRGYGLCTLTQSSCPKTKQNTQLQCRPEH